MVLVFFLLKYILFLHFPFVDNMALHQKIVYYLYRIIIFNFTYSNALYIVYLKLSQNLEILLFLR